MADVQLAKLSAVTDLEAATTAALATKGDVFSTAPVFTGSIVTTANELVNTVIDTTDPLNVRDINADTTYTFSAQPSTANTWFKARIHNTGVVDRTVTIPSSTSRNRGAAITSFVVAAGVTEEVSWCWTGSAYLIFNDPMTAAQVKAVLAIAESDVTGLVTDLALKAPLSSPTFTNTPAAPTASPGTNTTQLATTAFVTAAVAAGGGRLINFARPGIIPV